MGIARPFATITMFDDRMSPSTAAATVEPRLRITELSPFAAAVSLAGTERMMSVGMAA